MGGNDAREFLVLYDYGMGGVWGLASAYSEADVLESFPELRVVRQMPAWMTAERQTKLRSESSFVVGEPGTYPEWLQALIAER